MARCWFWLVAAALAGGALVAAQVPVFRAGTTLVPIDVHAVDRAGRPVTDLTANDFVVLEDGVRQPLRHFAARAFTPEAAPATPAPLRQVAAPAGSGETGLPVQTARIFLVVLGSGRLQVPNKGLDAALHLVRDRLLPQDRVAVLAYDRATDFTTDHASVAGVIERYIKASPSIETKLAMLRSGLAGLYMPPGIPKVLRADVDGIFAGERAPGVRTLPQEQAPERQDDAEHRRRVTQALLANPDASEFDAFDKAEAAMEGLSFDAYVAGMGHDAQDLGNIQTGITYLRHFDGEKHLVYISQGGVTRNVTELARNASQARVAVDILHTGGLGGPSMQLAPPSVGPRIGPGGSPMDSYLSRGTSLLSAMQARELAAETGGTFYANLHPMASGDIDAMDRASRFQYTLGYYTTRPDTDGRYHRIQVQVTRPGVTLQYRHGYYADPPPPAIGQREVLSYARMIRAFQYDQPVGDLQVSVRARRSASPEGASQVAVEATVSPARVTFVDVKGRHVGSIEVGVFALDRNDRQVGQLWQRVELNLLDATYERTKQIGIAYQASVDAPPDARRVKVVVYDYAADLLGSAVVAIGEK